MSSADRQLPPAVQQLVDQLMADTRKAALLVVLLVALVFFWIRTFRQVVPVAAADAPLAVVAEVEPDLPEIALGDARVRSWMNTDVPPVSRNLFVVDYGQFGAGADVATLGVEPGGFWRQLEEAMSARAEGRRRRALHRQRIADDAARLDVQATWVRRDADGTPRPEAVISGHRYGIGDYIDNNPAGLRVIAIRRQQVVVQCDGVSVTVGMTPAGGRRVGQ